MFLKDDNVEFYNGIETLYGIIESIHDDGTYDIYSTFENRTYYKIDKYMINEREKNILKSKDIKRFLKLEVTQDKIFNDLIYKKEFEKEEDIFITLEELQYALNVYNGTKTNKEFINDFAIALSYFVKEKDFLNRKHIKFNNGLPELDSFISNFDYRFKDDLSIDDSECSLDEYIYDIDNYFLNEDKSMSKWKYSTYMKTQFVEYYCQHENELLDNQNLLKLYKKYAVELCDLNIEIGLRVIGYGTYERGNLFRVDYKKSYECIHNLYTLYHDEYAPLSIGYMYYYGRLNNGKPDYDKSFKYFSIAHEMNENNIEAIYKLADHYINGYSVDKDLKLAFDLLENIYLKLYHDIESSDEYNEFIQVSYRMASIYSNHHFKHYNIIRAIEILMGAKKILETNDNIRGRLYKKTIDDVYGLLFRLKDQFVGDKNVNTDIGEYFNLKVPTYISDNLCKGYELKIKIKKLDDDGFRMTIKQKEENKKILYSLPYVFYSGFSDEVSHHIEEGCKFIYNNKEIKIDDDFEFDLYSYDDDFDDHIENVILYDKNRNSLRILTDVIYTEFNYDKDDFYTYTIVAVKFNEYSNKTYDYISSSDNVEIGDTVKVIANEEIKEVFVVDVKKTLKINLKLPLNYYKKTL